MRHLKTFYLAIGLVLLGAVLWEVDVVDVGVRVSQIGWGLAAVVGLYFLAFVIDSFTWQMALVSVPLNATWLYRTWKVRMVGEVFNYVIPAASMGGEPVKAVLLNKYYGIGYADGTASIVLGKTINLVALIIFLGAGFAYMWESPVLPMSYKVVSAAGLAGLTVATLLFFSVQRFKLTSLTGSWIRDRSFGQWIENILHHIRDMDDRLVQFYTRYRGRFAMAVALAVVNWVIGVFEVYVTMMFLGNPVSITDAWIIEAVAQLVRAGTFFIPASIGAQEGAFVLVCAAITGSPSLGGAVAVVRRIREILWLLWGALLGAMFKLAPVHGGDGE